MQAPLSVDGIAGEWIHILVDMRDPDDDAISLSVAGLPSAHLIEWPQPNQALVRWAPLPSEGTPAGLVWPVQFVARDSRGAEGRAMTMVRVVRPAIAPHLDVPAVLPLPFAARNTLAALISAVDPDSTQVDLELALGPAGMRLLPIGPKQAVLAWAPTSEQRFGPRLVPLSIRASDGEAPPEQWPAQVALIDPGASPCLPPPTLTVAPLPDLDLQESLTFRATLAHPQDGPLDARLWLQPEGARSATAVQLAPSRLSAEPVEWFSAAITAESLGLRGPALVHYWVEASREPHLLSGECTQQWRWPRAGRWTFAWGGEPLGACLDDAFEGGEDNDPIDATSAGRLDGLRLCADADVWRFQPPAEQIWVLDVLGPDAAAWARRVGSQEAAQPIPARFVVQPADKPHSVDIEVFADAPVNYALHWGASAPAACTPASLDLQATDPEGWQMNGALCAGQTVAFPLPAAAAKALTAQLWLDWALLDFELELQWGATKAMPLHEGAQHTVWTQAPTSAQPWEPTLHLRTAPHSPGGAFEFAIFSGSQASPCAWWPPPALMPWTQPDWAPLRLCSGSPRAFRSALAAGESLAWWVESLDDGPINNLQTELWARWPFGEWMLVDAASQGVWQSSEGVELEWRIASEGDIAALRLTHDIIAAGPSCPTDRFEPNDTQDASRPLPAGPSMHLHCCGQPDWYTLLASPGELAQLHLVASQGAVAIELRDANGEALAEGTAEPGQSWWTEVPVIFAPLYWRVAPVSGTAHYHLHWSILPR